jgi:hypothetical protein
MSGMTDSVAFAAVNAGHGLVSFAYPDRLPAAVELCQSFALDNGAYSIWKSGRKISWDAFYELVDKTHRLPNFDFAVIPDKIDGDEKDNDRLVEEWPWRSGRSIGVGAPVWHPHESIDRLERLAAGWPRLCIGGSADFRIGSQAWWTRVAEAMDVICDPDGVPFVKIHGLRLLDHQIVRRIPLSSADSTNISRNIKFDTKWTGRYRPLSPETRAKVLRERIESVQPPAVWERKPIQSRLIA